MHVSVKIIIPVQVRWTRRSNMVEPLVMVTSTWSFNFVISKYLDCIQHCKKLLEQCGHVVAKVEAIENMLGRGANSCLLGHVTKIIFRLYLKHLLPSIFDSADFWSSISCISLDTDMEETNVREELGVVSLMAKFRGIHFVLQESTNPQIKQFFVQETCTEACGLVTVWTTVRLQHFA